MFKYFKNSLYKLSEFRRFLKLTKQKKQVIFYAENESQWDFFEDTIEYLLKKKVPIHKVSNLINTFKW
tara:strand:- start:619 stop:822 length:204 start_codon:yes stop_codon:yes gene_type:complete